MNTQTIFACLAITALFAIGWLIEELLHRRRKQRQANCTGGAQLKQPLEKRCAWCDKEQGITPRPGP